MKQYDVTIGIPIFRAVNYIEKTMESALKQTYPSIEFLLIDDCGQDGSMDVVERMKSEHPRGNDIRILYHEQNYGVGVSRNHILDEARGRYLFFLDSDDLIEPHTIHLLLENIKKYGADIVYGSLERIDKVRNNPPQLSLQPDICLLAEDEMALYAFKNIKTFPISVCNCLMDLDFLRAKKLRFLDTVFWEDLAFSYEMVTKVSRAVLLSDITYHYICRSGSLSHYQDRDQLEKSEILKNVSTIDYLKKKCLPLKAKPYLPFLCKNLEVNSFYIVCHILKHSNRIVPPFSYREMRNILRYPLPLKIVSSFHHVLPLNLLFYILGHSPVFFFVPIIWLLGILKKSI